MRQTVVGVAGAACALWLGVVQLAAQPPAAPDGGVTGAPWRGRLERVLGLSDQQKAAFQKTLQQQRPEMESLHSELRGTRQKLDEALAAESPDPAVVGELAIQQHRLLDKQRAMRVLAEQTLRALLTPEQQTKFDVLQSLRPGRGRFGPGAGFGGPWGGGAHPRLRGDAPREQQ